MIIAIVDFHVSPTDRERAVDILRSDGAAAAARPGNRAFRVFTDAASPTHVGVLHEWDAAADFAFYTRSEAFAAVGAKLRPMMTAAPVSRRLVAEPLEEVLPE